jgi:Diacylglycerol acyltransferase
MGVEMAPLNVPFQRRLQTLTALFNSFVFFFGGFLTFVGLLFLLHTKFYWVPLIYAAWLWFDRDTCSRGGRPWKALRYSNMYNYLRDFFPISLVKTGELDAKENFIIGYHPHGEFFAWDSA